MLDTHVLHDILERPLFFNVHAVENLLLALPLVNHPENRCLSAVEVLRSLVSIRGAGLLR